ncbi:hypothetical protein [Bacteroides salyersiae]|uniref:hypothetical protein n=1 Tax=Bacteroides salyersiae TaxID=291644 RepID=UPI001C8BD0CA|nr:hypothetical protein [Bacteroides salyersiae]
MQKKVIIFVLSIFFVFLISISLMFFYKELSLSQKLSECQKYRGNIEFYRMIYQDIFLTLDIQGRLLRKDMRICDETGNKLVLKDLVDGKKLVMRYSELNCNVCVDSLLACLKERFDTIGWDKLLILATYHNKSNYYIFKRINKLKNVYQIDSIGCSLEEYNIPFLFLLDEDYSVKYPFIPHKEIMRETESYLDFIVDKLNF